MSYNPVPTRVWSRVQNRCTFIDSSDNTAYQNVYDALSGKTGPLAQALYNDKVIYKGNILQYKKNSSNLTKKQKYTQICKGMWTNRTKSYATQSQTYTNPNTSNLLRVNYSSAPSPGTSYIPGPYNFNIPYPNACISDTIKDGGSLLCNTVANPCTDEVIEVSKNLQCYSTSCSDVPGPEQLLCWDPQLNTWYPRQRYTMPTSGTKWPEGYKGFVSGLKPPTPVLTLVSTTSNSVTLSWTVTNDDCIPISSYNIYLNGQIYTTVSYTTTTITINNLSCTNSFYVTSVSNTTESEPSNTITVLIAHVWSALGSGLDNDCYALAFGPDGSVYAGGSFTTPASKIAKWNGSTWSSLGSGLDNDCYAIAFDSNGNLYAGGSFSTAGGVGVNFIAKWNGTTWSALGTGLGSTCRTISIGPDGSVYAGGFFITAGGNSASYIAKWNGTTWSALGSGLDNSCSVIVFDSNSNLYAGGDFTTAGGISASRIAKWNGTTWSALGTGLGSTCRTISIGPDGSLYAGGNFANYIAKWNGTTWSALGTGLGSTCRTISIGPDGSLYAGGDFTTAGGNFANYIAKWNGTTWSALDSGLGSTCFTIVLETNNCNYLYAGGSFITAGGVSANHIAKY
jgi:hypothetical protein